MERNAQPVGHSLVIGVGYLNKMFVWFTVCVYHESLSICMCGSSPYDFEGETRDLIVLVPDHCLSFYFASSENVPINFKTVSFVLSETY